MEQRDLEGPLKIVGALAHPGQLSRHLYPADSPAHHYHAGLRRPAGRAQLLEPISGLVRLVIKLHAQRSLHAGDAVSGRREDRAERHHDQLGLKRAADTVIGNVRRRGISGGERKRLSIGCELLSDPTLLFLDEPTSGLDAFQAQQVVSLLKTLAADEWQSALAPYVTAAGVAAAAYCRPRAATSQRAR